MVETIPVPSPCEQAQELVFTPWGELLVSDSGSMGRVTRWKYEKVGKAYHWNQVGFFTVAIGLRGTLHGMVFRGYELFIADPNNSGIYRLTFDTLNPYDPPQPNGWVSVGIGPVDLCLDSVGRMYVSGHLNGQIARIIFDETGAATVDRYWAVDTYLGGIDFRP